MPDLRTGGAERVAVNLANMLVNRNFSVDMVVLRRRGDLLRELDSRVRVVDLGVRRVRQSVGPMIRYLKQARPLAVLANMWPLTVVAWLSRQFSDHRVRLVFVEHTTWSIDEQMQRRGTRWLIQQSMRALYGRADAVVAVSDGAARDLESIALLPRGAVKTIYNPIVTVSDAEIGTLCCPNEWSRGSHKRVLAVGTLKAVKDYPTLIKAFAALAQHVDATLLILGEGEEREALETQVSSLGLESRVFMPGSVADPRPYYASADLFVLSSRGEGFGNVIVEALAEGTPVVSTDCQSGPREILEGGQYGALVPVGDPEALAIAMREALLRAHDHDALKRRAGHFSVERAADAYLDLLVPDWRDLATLMRSCA